MVERNPKLELSGVPIQTIGDAHFGRVFKTNVPLHRRGEYEEAQMQAFLELLNIDCNLKIQTGDLLDKAQVSTSVLIKLITELEDFENNGKSDRLFIISGNHDDSKSSTEPTAWDILAKFFANSHKVVFVKNWHLIELTKNEYSLLVGWNIHHSVAQAFIAAKDTLPPEGVITSVFCHLDRISYGDDHNVIPYDFLKNHGVSTVITGHEHKPFSFYEGSLKVIGTGSLMPFSHAEDPEAKHYQTIKFKDLDLNNLAEYQNKHIRVLVSEEDYSEAVDLNFDCLSLQIKKVKVEDDAVEKTQVEIQSYSAKELWQQAVDEANLLDAETAKELWLAIEEKGISNE